MQASLEGPPPLIHLLRGSCPCGSVVSGALFHEPEIANSPGGLVIVRDVDFASTSETSLLPFYGRCHLGYLPSHGVVLGLSKVARLVAMLAKRLQTQERFTQELLDTFEAEVLPQVRLAKMLFTTACIRSSLSSWSYLCDLNAPCRVVLSLWRPIN